MNFGCVVLCPDRNVRSLALTVRSIHNFIDVPCVAVVPKGTPLSVTEDMKPIASVYRGNVTYTSLINVGVSKLKADWAVILVAGTVVRPRFWMRYSVFMEDDKDVIFPITAGKTSFVESPINGLMMHTNAIKRIGKMPETSNIEESKAVWAYQAIEAGHKLKGILGVRLAT